MTPIVRPRCNFIRNAWKQVLPATIQNCLNKANFKKIPTQRVDCEIIQGLEEDDLPFSVIVQ